MYIYICMYVYIYICVKSVRIRSYSGPCFPAFKLKYPEVYGTLKQNLVIVIF